jgi:hypothetical protein
VSADFKPKFIPWYEDDFRADRQVARMTTVQRSLCRTLIIESYYNELRPYVPDDDAKLWQLADAESPQQWLQNKDVVLAKFKLTSDGQSLLYNKRVLEQWEIMQGLLQQKKNAGAASAAARQARAKENLPQTPSKSKEKQIKSNKSVKRSLNDRSTLVQDGLDFFLKRTGKTLLSGKKHKAALDAYVQDHGEDVAIAAIKRCADDSTTNWSKIDRPWEFFLSRQEQYLSIAREDVTNARDLKHTQSCSDWMKQLREAPPNGIEDWAVKNPPPQPFAFVPSAEELVAEIRAEAEQEAKKAKQSQFDTPFLETELSAN